MLQDRGGVDKVSRERLRLFTGPRTWAAPGTARPQNARGEFHDMSSSSRFVESLERRRFFAGSVVELPVSAAALPGQRRHRGIGNPDETDNLTAPDVETILGQAASQARPGQAIVVADREGIILGIYGMSGLDDNLINGVAAPGEAEAVIQAATSRARTAAFFVSNENAFTTRTARFII